MVDLAKLRWRIERDYLELKQEVGLDHYEGRGWRGFHHHATLCIAAYGFLISEKETIPPSGPAARLAPHAICRSRWLPTRRCCRCARNATCRIPSQRCAFVSHVPCSARCPDVPAAAASVRDRRCGMNDAVGLASWTVVRQATRRAITPIIRRELLAFAYSPASPKAEAVRGPQVGSCRMVHVGRQIHDVGSPCRDVHFPVGRYEQSSDQAGKSWRQCVKFVI